MAKKYEQPAEDEEDDLASYNDAKGSTFRAHELIKVIIACMLNPFAFNENGTINFEARHQALKALWQETRPKCTDPEIKFIDRLGNIMQEAYEKHYPIKTLTKKNGVESYIDGNEYKIIDKICIGYFERINKLRDKHGLGNPSTKRDDGL